MFNLQSSKYNIPQNFAEYNMVLFRDKSGSPLASRRAARSQISHNGHPIGHGYADPVEEKEDSNVLDHQSEAEHLASIVRDSAGLKTSEEFKGLVVRKNLRAIWNSTTINRDTLSVRGHLRQVHPLGVQGKADKREALTLLGRTVQSGTAITSRVGL